MTTTQATRVKTVAVIFGGRSVEHEVSIITAHQGMNVLKSAGYEVLPIYISREGRWFAGAALHDIRIYGDPARDFGSIPDVYRVSLSPDRGIRQLIHHPGSGKWFRRRPTLWADVFFPMIHGSYGEDGTLQGLLEMADVPYVGCHALASALGIDKAVMKRIAREAGIPVLDCLVFAEEEINNDLGAVLAKVKVGVEWPAIVKPVHLGSSVGIRRCDSWAEMPEALSSAAALDSHVLVEHALEDFIEINCSVLGPPIQTSPCEQPEASTKLLSFEDKYGHDRQSRFSKLSMGLPRGLAGQARKIPAPIGPELTGLVQQYSRAVFEAIGASGVCRVDFLYDRPSSQLYFNEINTLPGSLAHYLWEAGGLYFDELLTKLIEIAVRRHEERGRRSFTFRGDLLGGLDATTNSVTNPVDLKRSQRDGRAAIAR